MLITIDTDKDNERTARLAIGFIAHYYNLEPSEPEVPSGTSAPFAPAGATAAAAPAATAAAAAIPPSASVASVPPPPSNVIPLFQPSQGSAPPPPPSVNTAAPTTPAAPATSAAAVGTAVSGAPAEYDSAGMPWDARIHQKAKGKKKDGTWKLIKGIDEATVQTVTVELSARKIATPASPSAPVPGVAAVMQSVAASFVPPPPPAVGAVPPPPATVAPQVFLPDANNAEQQHSVPVPPVAGNAAVANVPTPNGPVAPSVPVPPVAPAGPVGVSYRSIIDKMTAGTRENKLTAAKVLEIVINCGCPNLQQLNQMPNVWADVDAKIDLALAGLL